MEQISAVIFDLDNCLSPADEVGLELIDPAFHAIRAANDGSVSEGTLQAAFSDVWKHAFDWVVQHYAFTPAMRDAGWRALVQVVVTKPMRGYGDLEVLGRVPGRLFLVTSGFHRLQESKIHALGIASRFEEVVVDAIDRSPRMGKRAIFEAILAKYRLAPNEVVAVGDNPESELVAARQLGIVPVQILRPGVMPSDIAAAQVGDLEGLISWLERSQFRRR